MKAPPLSLRLLAMVALLGLAASPSQGAQVQPAPVQAASVQVAPAQVAPPPAAPTEAAPAPATSVQAAPNEATPAPARLRRATARYPSASREPIAATTAPGRPMQTAEPIRIALILTLLGLIPALAICVTPFIRIIVVLSMIRHAMGMPETPPNQVLVSLALFLTIFTILPTVNAVNATALQPFMAGSISVEQAVDRGQSPVRAFMLRQVSDRDLKTIYEISKQPLPSSASQVGFMQLTSAFMLNELRVGFKIGFVILLPFLLIDLIVSSILLSLGMLMVPPATLSLPLKVLMFVLIDGWSTVLQGVVGSFK